MIPTLTLKRLSMAMLVSFALAPAAKAETVDPDALSYTARQLLQIALMDDQRIDYHGLDGQIGPKTLEAIADWQALEGHDALEALDRQVVCALIKLGIKGHGSSSKLPDICN